MPKPFSPAVVIKSIDRARIEQAVEQYLARLRSEHPQIERVIWFGSWTNSLPSPGSDVDRYLIVSATDKPPCERVANFCRWDFR
ncbi:nucleotidyltransferase domain-containing protein [Chloroflexus sp.]|uniref:nucleotidyltransferase domain-containing protein n=1 Tax=Chloroflexus sp. TaxID=1904827 RepID=UPI002ADD513B|nr:nucleotidyltransferase domain-containing protein [Chloroflexus sp.]